MLYEKLRDARKRKEITQEQLAEALGVRRAVISKYETGVIEPSISQLKKMAVVLGVTVSDLLYDGPATSFKELYSRMEQNSVELPPEETYKMHKQKLNDTFDTLNTEGQQKAVESVEIIAGNPKFQKSKP